MQAFTVIFSAVIKHVEIHSQTITLGGVYPDIEVEHISADGLHKFKIKKNAPNSHPSMLDPIVKEASSQIESFWIILEHILNSPIQSSEDIEIQLGNGPINPYKNISEIGMGSISLSSVISENWFTSNKNRFFENYNLDLIKRVNFAKRLVDPTSRFLSLYSIISSLANDKQGSIDAMILNIDPTVEKKLSPHKSNGKNITETTFTRLRNELAHHREDTSIFGTHREIKLHVDRFQYIVDLLIKDKLTS